MFTKETYARAKNNTIAGLCRSSSKEMRLIPTLFRPCVPLHQAPPLPVWALSAITPNILARHGRHAFVSSWVSLLHPFARLTQNFTQLSFVSPRITAHGYQPPLLLPHVPRKSENLRQAAPRKHYQVATMRAAKTTLAHNLR